MSEGPRRSAAIARRRPRAGVAAALVLSLAGSLTNLGCPAKDPPRPPPYDDPAADAEVIAPLPDPVAQPTNREEGDVLVLTIPRVGGDVLDLRELRGRVVVLELSATWVEGWRGRYALYNDLLRAHGAEHLAVVLIAMDSEREAITVEPAVRSAGFELGWDPQGAVAAQLQAAAVPTAIVVDRQGRIAHIEATDVTPQAITDALSSTLSAP